MCLPPPCWGHPEDLSVPVRGKPRVKPPQRVRTCWLLWFPLDKGEVGVVVTTLALMPVGNRETPSRAAGSYPRPGAGRGRPLVPERGRGSRAPMPAALAASPAPSHQ